MTGSIREELSPLDWMAYIQIQILFYFLKDVIKEAFSYPFRILFISLYLQ
jgi:hypothetical protein